MLQADPLDDGRNDKLYIFISDYWRYTMVFEILALVVSILVIPIWLLWIFMAKSSDVLNCSVWLKATVIALLYTTG